MYGAAAAAMVTVNDVWLMSIICFISIEIIIEEVFLVFGCDFAMGIQPRAVAMTKKYIYLLRLASVYSRDVHRTFPRKRLVCVCVCVGVY